MRNHLLLDNQSSVHNMCNPIFVNNIWESSQPMVLKSNGGSLPIYEVADFERFKRETWFLRNAMININRNCNVLPLSLEDLLNYTTLMLKICTNKPIRALLLRQVFWGGGERGHFAQKRV